MMSTQRSESTNHSISFNSNKQTPLTQFFHLFDAAIERWRETEIAYDFTCSRGYPKTTNTHILMYQASKIYTLKIYEFVLHEFKRAENTKAAYSLRSNGEHQYIVTHQADPEDVGIVTFKTNEYDGDINVSCNCKHLEEVGWLCFHC